MATSKDHQNNIVAFEYDAIGQQTAIIEPLGLRTETTYDIRGNKLSVTDPDRGAWVYRSNALGLLV
jgi:YD repeat-containing protein